jgi:hypothetical protein
MKELQEKLRKLSDEIIPENEQFFRNLIAPLLPDQPLTPEFLKETIAPLYSLNKAVVLEFLAHLGRREVADVAAELLESPEIRAIDRLELAVALARCGDRRGFKALEELFLYSLRRPKDERYSVPFDWITEDVLRERLGSPEALELRQRLVTLYNSSRSSGN